MRHMKQDMAHGWRGNTTDDERTAGTIVNETNAVVFIRGIATPSVGYSFASDLGNSMPNFKSRNLGQKNKGTERSFV